MELWKLVAEKNRPDLQYDAICFDGSPECEAIIRKRTMMGFPVDAVGKYCLVYIQSEIGWAWCDAETFHERYEYTSNEWPEVIHDEKD